MPNYNSKSYKKSKNSKNSKSGGRRRKHTMRKYRRGRKVMRGGADKVTYEQLKTQLSNDGAMQYFLDRYNMKWNKNVNTFDDFKKEYDEFGKTIQINEIKSNLVDYQDGEGTTLETSLSALSGM